MGKAVRLFCLQQPLTPGLHPSIYVQIYLLSIFNGKVTQLCLLYCITQLHFKTAYHAVQSTV